MGSLTTDDDMRTCFARQSRCCLENVCLHANMDVWVGWWWTRRKSCEKVLITYLLVGSHDEDDDDEGSEATTLMSLTFISLLSFPL